MSTKPVDSDPEPESRKFDIVKDLAEIKGLVSTLLVKSKASAKSVTETREALDYSIELLTELPNMFASGENNHRVLSFSNRSDENVKVFIKKLDFATLAFKWTDQQHHTCRSKTSH